MRNIKINEAETIFEAFWDSGESYPNHEKYTCLNSYKIDKSNGTEILPDWSSVVIKMQENSDYVFLEKECDLNIENYDIFRFTAILEKSILVKIICVIDGKEVKVAEVCGTDKLKEYNGKICGKLISKIRMEFYNTNNISSTGNLLWMGLSNVDAEEKMLQRENGYDDSWEGCFYDVTVIKPQNDIYFNDEELKELRLKLSEHPYKQHMDLLRKEAKAAMDIIPEKEIGTYVHKNFKRFVRERDQDKVCIVEEMPKLAFVGIIDENYDMLKMACRMALSVSCCTYFCESIIGVFPGATWHHRSFTEEDICKALIKVLEWAGGLLTWHGKNIIYDAIIMKGLPRLDADVKTMDYIWSMNQGTAFVSSLVIILIALQKKYPRYSARIDEAEKDMYTMWQKYTLADGGCAEGARYWAFTLSQMMEALYLLARYRGKKLEEYVDKSIKKSCGYALAVLSDAGDFCVPVNDCHIGDTFSGGVCLFLATVSGEEIWKRKSNQILEEKPNNTDRIIEYLIFSKKFYSQPTLKKDEYISLPITGHTTIRRNTNDFGTVGLHTICEKVFFGHTHADKGSFLLEANGKSLLIDRGVCDYGNVYEKEIKKSEMHNVLAAVKNDKIMSQIMFDESLAVNVFADYFQDDIFYYGADVTEVWKELFKKHRRYIISPSPYLYFVCDIVEAYENIDSCFILNTYGRALKDGSKAIILDGTDQITVTPINWLPEKLECGQYREDGNGRSVNRIAMYKKCGGIFCTMLELSKANKAKAKVIDNIVEFEGKKIICNEQCLMIENKKFDLN